MSASQGLLSVLAMVVKLTVAVITVITISMIRSEDGVGSSSNYYRVCRRDHVADDRYDQQTDR